MSSDNGHSLDPRRRPFASDLPELAALDDYRLRHHWSWASLSAAMAKAGVHMSPRTLHHICRRAHSNATVAELTLLKVRQFITRKRIRVGTPSTEAQP